MSLAYPLSENEAASLRSEAKLQALRKQARVVSQSEHLPGTPAQLWPVCALTDFLNQAVGMQATDNHYLTRDYGSTWMHAQTKNAGLTVAYEELPYEWEAPFRYQVERIHSKGPLKYLCFGVELEALEGEQTRLTCRIHFVSILPAPVAKLMINKEISRFMQVFRHLAAELASGTPALLAFFDTSPQSRSLAADWAQAWQGLLPEPKLAAALADYLARAPEKMAYRLRPFELALAYQLDPLEVLKACLLMSREGLLHLMWDCRCPGCKGPKESFRHLSELKDMAYCPTCAVNYGLAFDQNLELTFQPVASLRPTRELYFCAGSPGNTPHISWQQNFLPGQQRHFQLDLPPGPYVMRSLSASNEQILMLLPAGKTPENAQNKLVVTLQQDQLLAQTPQEVLLLSAGAELQFHNQNPYEATIMLENLLWQAQAVTAARVQSVQAFHDLFPDQVLAANEHLPLQSQIFLNISLLDLSPDREAEMGDIQAWLQSRVQNHEGALLAADRHFTGVFASGYEALAAAWEIQQELPELNLLYDLPLQLGLGIAQGPCEVYVKAGRLAYRGPAFEMARAAALRSEGQGIVVSESLLQAPEMADFLENPLVQWQILPTDLPEVNERWILFCFAQSLVDVLF